MIRILDFSICDPTVLLDTHVKYKKNPQNYKFDLLSRLGNAL